MDALALTLIQNNTGAAVSARTDNAALDTEIAGVDFAALLALGLNVNAPSPAIPQAVETDALDIESAPEAQPLPDALEVFAALPQFPLAQAVSASSKTAVALAETQGTDAQVTRALLSTNENRPVAGAAIAGDAANIAARGEALTAAVRQETAADDSIRYEDLGLDLQRLSATETTPKLESLAHTVHAQPVEIRPLAPQPSALLEVAAPVSEPGFADAFSRQVVWMVGKDVQVAELRINPPELGPVEIRLTISGDEATAQFVSAHAEVREAIENAIARLRETMAQAGIQLGETSVSAESFADQAGQQADARATRQGYRDEQASDNATSQQGSGSKSIVKRGLVDVFA